MKDFIGFRKYIMERQMKVYGTFNNRKGNYSQTKVDNLIDGIVSGRYQDDAEAAWELYRSKPMDKRYQMLKFRIKDQLYNYVFLVDNRSILPANNFLSFFALANKYYAVGQLMMFYGLGMEGEEVLKECLRIAKKYKMAGLILNTSRLLKARVGYKGTQKEYNLYKKNMEEYMEVYKAELEGEDLRDTLNLAYRKTFSPQDKKKLKNTWLRINQLYNLYQTHTLRINRLSIGTKYFETMGDFKGVVRICDEMLEFMRRNPKFYDKVRDRETNIYKLDALLILRDYKRAEVSAESVLKLHNDYSNGSIMAIEYVILLNLHTRNYEKAWLLYSKSIQKEFFSEYPRDKMEKWKLFEAYLSFVYPESKLRIKSSKLMKELPMYSRDKRGVNIAIIIAQIILLLDEGDFDTLLDRADSFKVYFKRYVNKQINYRTYCFVKMIETIFRHNFNYEKIETTSQSYYQHLSDKEGFYKGDLEALEIVPYEDLWSQIILRLKKHEFAFMHPVG